MSVDADDINLVQPTTINATPTPVSSEFERIGALDRSLLARAALRAKRCFPGIIGETLASELNTWIDVGFRLDGHGHAARLVEAIMALPDPNAP